jgi:hypothetical protein
MIEVVVPGERLKAEVQRAIKAKVRAVLEEGNDKHGADLQALCTYQAVIMGWPE